MVVAAQVKGVSVRRRVAFSPDTNRFLVGTMTKIISVHEYRLRPTTDRNEFERAIRGAEQRGLVELPGLLDHYFLRGIRGARSGEYAAVWVYKSRRAWSQLWGSVAKPSHRQEYPRNWMIWENEVLAPFIAEDPDLITFTAYEQF